MSDPYKFPGRYWRRMVILQAKIRLIRLIAGCDRIVIGQRFLLGSDLPPGLFSSPGLIANCTFGPADHKVN